MKNEVVVTLNQNEREGIDIFQFKIELSNDNRKLVHLLKFTLLFIYKKLKLIIIDELSYGDFCNILNSIVIPATIIT